MKRRGFKRLMDAHPWLCNWALIPSLFKLGGFFHQLQQGQDFRAVWLSSLAKTAMKRCVFLSQVRATEVVQLPVFVSFVVKQQIPPTHVLSHTMRQTSPQPSLQTGKSGKLPKRWKWSNCRLFIGTGVIQCLHALQRTAVRCHHQTRNSEPSTTEDTLFIHTLFIHFVFPVQSLQINTNANNSFSFSPQYPFGWPQAIVKLLAIFS